MSETADSTEMWTKPLSQHEWLINLIGEWRTETEFVMEPRGEPQKSSGRETVVSLGGLWAFGEGSGTMPGGAEMVYKSALGYDVSFKEYRGCWFASASSHLWKYTGELSPDGKRMTLMCEGPDMVVDGKTAMYRDVIDLIDANRRTLTSFGQDDKGEWQQFMKCHYYRV